MFHTIRGLPLLLALTLSTSILAQPPTFEVATIKPSDPLNTHQGINLSGNLITATVTIKTLIERAYGFRDFQISGGPKWLDSDKYDITARSDETADPGKLSPAEQEALFNRQMQRIQSLLADRFQLKLHRTQKQMPIYALVVAKGGPKLQPPKPNEPHRLYSQAPGQLACYGTSMSDLADEFQDIGISRVVLDKTRLTGTYDFTLHWSPDDNPNPTGPSIFTALQEQLGLKLEPTHGPVETLIIDSIEKPSPN
jgi:uncharacterized protein (TIGR03435 family)